MSKRSIMAVTLLCICQILASFHLYISDNIVSRFAAKRNQNRRTALDCLSPSSGCLTLPCLLPLDSPLGGTAAVIAKQGAGFLGQVLLSGIEYRHGIFLFCAPAVYVPQTLLYILAGLILMREPDVHQLVFLMEIDFQLGYPRPFSVNVWKYFPPFPRLLCAGMLRKRGSGSACLWPKPPFVTVWPIRFHQ